MPVTLRRLFPVNGEIEHTIHTRSEVAATTAAHIRTITGASLWELSPNDWRNLLARQPTTARELAPQIGFGQAEA